MARYRELKEGGLTGLEASRAVLAEVQAEGEETQELLARLTDDDENRTQNDTPMSLGEYLRGFPNHDREHEVELATALDNIML